MSLLALFDFVCIAVVIMLIGTFTVLAIALAVVDGPPKRVAYTARALLAAGALVAIGRVAWLFVTT